MSSKFHKTSLLNNSWVMSRRGGGEHSIRPSTFWYLNPNWRHIRSQQPVSAKWNDGVWVRHDFYGFLSHQCQELWTVDMKDVLKILLRLFEQGFSKEVIFSTVLTENTRQLSVMSSRKFHTLKTSGVQTFGSCGFWSLESWNYNSLSCVQHNGGEIVSYSLQC